MFLGNFECKFIKFLIRPTAAPVYGSKLPIKNFHSCKTSIYKHPLTFRCEILPNPDVYLLSGLCINEANGNDSHTGMTTTNCGVLLTR